MMSNGKTWLMAAILCGCWLAFHVNGQQPVTKTARVKWEYSMAQIDHKSFSEIHNDFNTLGEDGWEYVGQESTKQATFAFFKRPKANQ